MYRIAIEDLIKWKDSEDRKPMIIKGARQVGKTWLMKEFGDKYYNQYVIRTSMSDYREQEWMTNVPLYCIEDLEHKNCD